MHKFIIITFNILYYVDFKQTYNENFYNVQVTKVFNAKKFINFRNDNDILLV